MSSFSRRDFIKILGISSLAPSLLSSCSLLSTPEHFSSLSPSDLDQLITLPGLKWDVLISEKDKITDSLLFGTNNDYLQFFPLDLNRGILWVNHEYIHPLLSSKPARVRENILFEMSMVGGSLIEIEFKNNQWSLVKNSQFNRRIDAQTPIPFAAGQKVMGQDVAIGTLANCAGGKTPWGTVLTCEENYDGFYGETDFKTKKHIPSQWLKWDQFFPYRPEHYGWVVEIDPKTGQAQKHTSMGRFAHECATVRVDSQNIPVVYTGDDTDDEHLYKFISSKEGSLENGILYAAHLESGQWLALDINNPKLQNVFRDQLDILIHARVAAKILGATPLDRPEDIEIDPLTGDVFVALTNNKKAGRPFGKILKIKEENNNPSSLSFTHEIYLSGGGESMFACPDNLAFDKAGNLWITTDISGWSMNKGDYKDFKNNGLFVVLRNGPQAGIPIQIASAPRDAEFTGPLFSPDHKTLFLSVQHPGELTQDLRNPTSNWPRGGSSLPLSSVITLSGDLLDKIVGNS